MQFGNYIINTPPPPVFFPPFFFFQATKGDSKNAKKKNNKKTSKNKSNLSRANKKKPGMPNVSNDLSQKLYATMEKHKEVWGGKLSYTYLYFTVCLFITVAQHIEAGRVEWLMLYTGQRLDFFQVSLETHSPLLINVQIQLLNHVSVAAFCDFCHSCFPGLLCRTKSQ